MAGVKGQWLMPWEVNHSGVSAGAMIEVTDFCTGVQAAAGHALMASLSRVADVPSAELKVGEDGSKPWRISQHHWWWQDATVPSNCRVTTQGCHTAHRALSTSACSSTVRVAFSRLSGG